MKTVSKKRLYFMELAMSGVYHSGINSSFIKVLEEVFPETEEIIFCAEKKHLENSKSQLESLKQPVIFKSLYLPKVSLSTLVFRDLLGVLYAFWALIRSGKKDLFFFSYVLPFTHITIILVNGLLKRRIFICLHGQMEAFIPESPLRLTKYYFGMETPFFKLNKWGYYIILGEPIRKEIAFLFSASNKLIVVDHPYNYDTAVIPAQTLSLPLRIGQIGVGDAGKGSGQIFQLAAQLKDLISAGTLVFSIVGKLNPNLYKFDNGLVKYEKQPLEDEAFKASIARLHYTLFLRNDSQGIAVASGSFFDTVKFLKPYISLDNRFISYYAAAFPGTGIICHSVADMGTVIRDLVKKQPVATYDKSTAEIGKMRENLSIKAIAANFRHQL